jgi:hypothetical protein
MSVWFRFGSVWIIPDLAQTNVENMSFIDLHSELKMNLISTSGKDSFSISCK